MRDFERTREGLASVQADNGPSAAPRDQVVELINAGNSLQEQGRVDDAMARYDAAIEADPQCARAHLNRGNILLARAQLDEARSAYQLAVVCDPKYAAAHFNLGNLNYGVGEFESALRNYRLSINIKPDFADAHVAMANALDSLGRAAEAIESYKRALTINPGYAEVHFNLGVLAMSYGRHAEAADCLRRAVEIKPDVAQFHHTLGTALSALDQLDAAEASLRRALIIEPESSEIACELAMALQCNRKSPEAVQLLVRALEHTPTWAIKSTFAYCVAHTRFAINEQQTRAALTTSITEPWGIPSTLCQPALSLIMLNDEITSCVDRANKSWPARLTKAALFGASGLAALAADPLLIALLEAAPVTTIEFERFLTCARHALLEIASSAQAPDPSDVAALPFYAALSRQCFVNEYIFYCDDGENFAAADCLDELLGLLDANAVVPSFLLLAVAAYFPLYSLRDAGRLLGANESRLVEGVLRQQIGEPLEELALRADVDCLTAITAGVSEKVRDQYEQNPYPRWVKLPICDQPRCFNDELRQRLPFASFSPLPDDREPEVLVAGCGTGSHSILVAQRIRDARVLAIDLSLRSISYAIRKTLERGIKNIEYAQADILNLGEVARTFDVIESAGVLHHLADPFMGWRALLSRLRPGGFMGLGFYSEVARWHVAKAREYIAAGGYASTHDDIRKFRQDLAAEDASVDMRWLTKSADFYSTSECRDLLFHVQEHRLTLIQIESFLAECELDFLGFELDPRVRHQYRVRFTDDPSGTNLSNWTRFEADNPKTFAGMYQFWIQKPR